MSSRRGDGVEIIRCLMAHHQSMGLLAIDNVTRRADEGGVHLDPLVQATEFLLQEQMPALLEVIGEGEDIAA
jgi:hypothetical protein